MRPNNIEFSGERKRVRCNEGLGAANVMKPALHSFDEISMKSRA